MNEEALALLRQIEENTRPRSQEQRREHDLAMARELAQIVGQALTGRARADWLRLMEDRRKPDEEEGGAPVPAST